MVYRVEFDWAPTYELVVSLGAYHGRNAHSSLRIGKQWAKTVQSRLTSEEVAALAPLEDRTWQTALHLLIRKHPQREDPTLFIAWLRSSTIGQLYEQLAPELVEGRLGALGDLRKWRDICANALEVWHTRYFSQLDPAIMQALANDYAVKKELVHLLSPTELVEKMTDGAVLEMNLDSVVLVPQYHHRPWNVPAEFRNCMMCFYPCDQSLDAQENAVERLAAVANALGDVNRLHILQYISQQPQSFMDIVSNTHLNKGSIHHHLIVLRAAGLIRVHISDTVTRYSFTHSSIDAMATDLKDLIMGKCLS